MNLCEGFNSIAFVTACIYSISIIWKVYFKVLFCYRPKQLWTTLWHQHSYLSSMVFFVFEILILIIKMEFVFGIFTSTFLYFFFPLSLLQSQMWMEIFCLCSFFYHFFSFSFQRMNKTLFQSQDCNSKIKRKIRNMDCIHTYDHHISGITDCLEWGSFTRHFTSIPPGWWEVYWL